MISRRILSAALLIFPILVWSGAPLLHLVLEHEHEDGDHRFCSLFHDLSQIPDLAIHEVAPEFVLLTRIDPSTPSLDGSVSFRRLSIRAPPISA